MGFRQQLTATVAYGLVATLSALVVSGGNLSGSLQGAWRSLAPEASGVDAATAASVFLPFSAGANAAPASEGQPRVRVAAAATTAPPARQVTAEILPPVPVIPAAPARVLAQRPSSETGSASLDATLRLARWLTQQWYDSALEPVWASFSPAVKAQWGSFGKFQAFRAGGKRAYGAETSVLAEELTPHGDVTYYTRTAAFERGPKDGWTLIIGLDARGQVQDFGVVGAALLPARMKNLIQ